MRFVSFVTYPDGWGWFRLGTHGVGLAWKPAEARLFFSERYGYRKTYVLFGRRWEILKVGQ